MQIIGFLVLGFIFFFGIVLFTLLLGALGKKDDREILQRSAEDAARGEGGLTRPPSPEGHSVQNPVPAS